MCVYMFGFNWVYKTNLREITVLEWDEVIEEGNFLLLCKRSFLIRYFKRLDYYPKDFKTSWHLLNTDYFKTFGIPENVKKAYELKRKIFKLNCKRILTKKRFLENEIFILNEDLKALNVGEVPKVHEIINSLESHYKRDFDENMSMYTFLRRLKGIKNGK